MGLIGAALWGCSLRMRRVRRLLGLTWPKDVSRTLTLQSHRPRRMSCSIGAKPRKAMWAENVTVTCFKYLGAAHKIVLLLINAHLYLSGFFLSKDRDLSKFCASTYGLMISTSGV
jgi:hypothetical protein